MAMQALLHPSGSRPRAFLQRQTTTSSLRFVSFNSSTSSFSYTASAMAKSSLHSLSFNQRIRSPIPKGAESDNLATAMPPDDNWMLVVLPPHPLIKHLIPVLRNEQKPPAIFKSVMAELGGPLFYEACRDWLPMIGGEIQSSLGVANVEFVDPREPVAIIPISRAGLAFVEHAATLLPATKTYHLGMSRDEETLPRSMYLNKMPEKFPVGSRILVIDPMLATGGTMVTALDLLMEKGLTPKQIKVISAVAAPLALEKLSWRFSGVHVYTTMLDPVPNEKGYVCSMRLPY